MRARELRIAEDHQTNGKLALDLAHAPVARLQLLEGIRPGDVIALFYATEIDVVGEYIRLFVGDGCVAILHLRPGQWLARKTNVTEQELDREAPWLIPLLRARDPQEREPLRR